MVIGSADTEVTEGISPVQAADLLGLNPDVVQNVIVALNSNDDVAIGQIVSRLHAAEVADLIEMLRGPMRAKLVDLIRQNFKPAILTELDEKIRDEIVEQLGTDKIAEVISDLESDDALSLISTLQETKQRRVLHGIPHSLRMMLEEGLTFPEESAGRLMQREFVAVPSFWNVGEVIDFLRENAELPNDFYDVFVVDPRHRLIGYVALSHILRTKRPVAIRDIMLSEFVSVPVNMDQEEVAYVFAQQDLISAPVVDDSDRLIGVITIDDIVDVIYQEAEEDIMRLGGVQEDDLYAAVLDTGKSRFSWLFLNLLTAIMASIVIGLFQGTIEQVVMLAVLMPIAASMGGNAGTQTLTVAVRAIAMKQLIPANALRVLSKEILVGSFNGVLFAVIIGLIAWIWSGNFGIAIVMAVAMVITMVIAGLAGAAIPLGLSRTRFDPAIASGVFLTTVTDVVAFMAFLGLGAWFLV
ncbi:MAG: Magnesium transporter MgtE [Alphaproteobacteria bacterium MarineAlpha11_Bin1]|nr:MAG: Magnesium transporter MgtE [Alphaproteobacteria bacterium MarineAlpha11_Bin1]|tara:strand:+ start:420 stop:1823 length:1404 start_codon:yes stop_codon:yes gene_type:complete